MLTILLRTEHEIFTRCPTALSRWLSDHCLGPHNAFGAHNSAVPFRQTLLRFAHAINYFLGTVLGSATPVLDCNHGDWQRHNASRAVCSVTRCPLVGDAVGISPDGLIVSTIRERIHVKLTTWTCRYLAVPDMGPDVYSPGFRPGDSRSDIFVVGDRVGREKAKYPKNF